MDKKQIQKQLEIFKKRVNKKFKPAKIILFGSYAKKNADEYSDIDILVISNKFKKMKESERFSQLYKLSEGLYPDINAFGFTPEEIKKTSKLSTLYEALKTGIVLQK